MRNPLIIGKLIIIVLVFWCSQVLQAQSGYRQGAPLIKNYTPAEYKAHLQNWDVLQDKRDVLYFANTSGVLIFNGHYWDLIPCSNNSTIRSLAKSKDEVIYVGAIGDLGYMAIDVSGKMFFKSLLFEIAPQYRDFNDVWKTYVTADGVFFVTSKMIFHYKNNKFSYIEGDFKPMFGCVVDDKFYILKKPGGIYYLENQKLKLLPGTEIFNDDAGKVMMLPGAGNQLLVATVHKGLYRCNLDAFHKNTKTTFPEKINAPAAETYFNQNQMYSGCKINDNKYAWGTISGGLCVTDSAGNIIEIINKNRGILSNIILNIYQDNRGNLWLAQPTGVSQVMISMPFSVFAKTNGLEGSINKMVMHDGIRYASTMQGVFKLQPYQFDPVNDNFSFSQVLPQTYFSWDMINYKNAVLATGPDDILILNNKTVQKMQFHYNMYCFGLSKRFTNNVFVGLIDGMALLTFSANDAFPKLVKQKRLPEVTEPIRRIVQDDKGDLWITTNYQGILHLCFNSDDVNDYTITRYDTKNGLPEGGNQFVCFVNNDLYVATNSGLYKKIKSNEIAFEKINWNAIPLFMDKTEFVQAVTDTKNRLWFNTGRGIFYILKGDSNIQAVVAPFKLLNSDFKEIHFNEGVWVGTSAGLYFYDESIDKNFNQDYNTLIYKIICNNDSVVFYGHYFEAAEAQDTFAVVARQQPNTLRNTFSNSENSLTFFFASPYYETDEKVMFSYKLEGYDKSWSQWNTETKKEYTNLHEGSYTFKVKAKNIFNKESETCTYSFEIEPPWYRTYWAFIGYLILFLIIFIGGLYFNSARLVKKNIKLERMVNERTAQIMQQKEEIQAQAELLEQSNKELEQLSVVASKTDNIVVIAAPDGTIEWANDTFTKTYGYSLEEFKRKRGKTIMEVTSNSDIQRVINSAMAEKKSVEYVSKTENKKGDFIWFHTTLTPIIDINNELVKIILIDSDITKIKTAEQEILIQNEEIGIQNKNMKTLIDELEEQKELLQAQNEYIQGSIRYAFTIQQSILPEQKIVNRYFDNFILFLPKDIVSGDFYWISEVLSFQNKLAFAMVDCTGHGVPGAFMSLIGNRLLNEIVNEKRITDPKQVLTLMDTKIVEVLNQSQSDNFDGMDMSFCILENNNETEKKLLFGGAQQPIFIFKAKEKELITLLADKRSLGGLESKKNIAFTNKEMVLQKGDVIYLMSDGWADQNNESKKRYCSSRIIVLLKEVAELPMEAQKLAISQSIKEWKGQTPQRDDISVLGLRV